MISRLSRSASACTVVSISSFCSSLSRVQRLSMRLDEALDAGQRRPQLVGHGGDQVGPLAVQAGPTAAGADGDGHAGGRPQRLVAPDPRRDQALVAVGQHPRLLGDAGAGARALERRVVLQPGTAVVAGQREHVDELRPDHLRAVDAEQLLRGPVDQHHGLVAVEDDDAVGQDVDRLTALPLHDRHPMPSCAPTASCARAPSSCAWTCRRARRPTAETRLGAYEAQLDANGERGGGVEAEGGGGGEVEALGAAVDRDADAVVGQGRDLGREAPGLVAEQPGRTPPQQVAGVVAGRGLAVAVGGEHGQSGSRGRRPRRPRRPARRRPAGGTGCRRWPGRSWGCRRRRTSPASTTPSAPAASAVRITVPALPGSRTSAQMATRRGRRRTRRRAGRRGSGRPRPRRPG